MTAVRMHAVEVVPDGRTVRRLVATVAPGLSRRAFRERTATGTDHLTVRLGGDAAVRLPRTPAAALQTPKELRWLPRLARWLPVAVPEPLAAGAPAFGYPWVWSIRRWVPGRTLASVDRRGRGGAVDGLAVAVAALGRLPTVGGPPPGSHNFGRGGRLADRDRPTREALGSLAGVLGEGTVARLEALWDDAVAAPPPGRPGWIHGDLSAGNLVVDDRAGPVRLTGVVDWGGSAVGDPACDLMAAWSVFDADDGERFLTLAGADPDAVRRARGWALSVAAVALPYYADTGPWIAAEARATLAAAVDRVYVEPSR